VSRRLILCALATLLLACSPPPSDPPAPVVHDLEYFLRRLRTLDHLPRMEHTHTAMASTWDRTGGNDDGLDFKRIEGDHNILLDVDGPGCIHRIHTGLLGEPVQGARIQIVLDQHETALVDMPVETLFAQPPFSDLTTGHTLPGTHFPIPFARHARVQLVNTDAVKHWGVVWQITYTRYPDDTDLRSLHLPLADAEQRELSRVIRAWTRSTPDNAAGETPPASEAQTLQRTLALAPGQSGQIDLGGCGVIHELRVGTTPATVNVLGRTRLRFFWDHAPDPSVDVPLGAFFGHGDVGHAPRALHDSLLMGLGATAAYSRFPMPFDDGASLVVDNGSDVPLEVRLRLELQPCLELDPDVGRFHATWHHTAAATQDAPHVGPMQIPAHRMLRQQGQGKYVGARLQLVWPLWPDWWGEGDLLIWTDEQDWPPSYHGTGTEEYFNSGWTMFERSAISGFVTVRPGPVSLYSFQLNDAFQFRDNIDILLETVGSYGGQLVVPALHPVWRTTALWYGVPARDAGSDP